MALIHCPNCGQSISDKAAVCPHCNYRNDTLSTTAVTCPECGGQYPKEQDACPACGASNGVDIPKKKKHKGIMITAIVLSAVILIGLIGAFAVSKRKAAIDAENLKIYSENLKKYDDNLKTVTYKMLDGAVEAETAGNLILDVWYNAIHEERNSETDKYTMENGEFVSDFNDALYNLFSDEDFSISLSAISNNQDEVLELMKQLKNPPDEYTEAYSALKAFYENYLSLTNIVIRTDGSYNSFSADFKNADHETSKSFDKMELYLS